MHQLSRRDARRIAVRAQALTADRPADLLDVVRRVSLLQLDPIKAIAPSAQLVAWSRLGSAYSPVELDDAMNELSLIELQGSLRPAEDMALHRAEMAVWPGPGTLRPWQEYQRNGVAANDGCRRAVLEALRGFGERMPSCCDARRSGRSPAWGEWP